MAEEQKDNQIVYPVDINDNEAFNLLHRNMKQWVSEQGWNSFRDIQRKTISTLLTADEDKRPNLVVSASTASGKALADYELVLTDSGWKRISELDHNDKVYGSDGQQHNILGIFPQGEKELYQVVLQDGRTIDCSKDHIWKVIDRFNGKESDKTTQEIIDGFITKKHGKKVSRFVLPTCSPIRYDANDKTKLPLNVRDLGTLLRNLNDEILNNDDINIDVLHYDENILSLCYDSQTQDITIPDLYKTASINQRKQLLFALLNITAAEKIDNQNSFELISSKSQNFISDVMELAYSLGYIATKYNTIIETDELPISAYSAIIYFQCDTLDIVDIIDLNSTTSMTCIAVDSEDHTYITTNYIVTHNTEAAFIPALSILAEYREQHKEEKFCQMLYVAPLKALINDQYRRLSEMSFKSGMNIPVYLWHGDAPQGQKNEMLREHDGIIMITPESLESFLMNRGEWCEKYMTPLVMVIDEFHAFLGAGRGKQMLSLLARIDMLNMSQGKLPATRIALSATLSKLDIVGKMLSKQKSFAIIDGTQSGNDEMEISVKAFDPRFSASEKREKDDDISIAKEIIQNSLGKKTLTFATSRMQVETIAATINDVCKHDNIDSQAFPHHGSLSKETRELLEDRLVNTQKPTMAVATQTLELGIDLEIDNVFQVGTTNTVSSLRQRVGRSGRRDGIKRFECIVTTAEKKPELMDEDLLCTIAEIELMKAGWFEPPNNKRLDISVMVSEILSLLKQYGSAYEDELYMVLVSYGAFYNVPKDLFSMIIRDMLNAQFIEQIDSGELLISGLGEKEINDWHFYATFQDAESYTVKSGGKTIGEIMPPDTSLMQLANGGTFMLGGKYWQVIPPMDMKAKTINVKQVSTRAKFLIPTSRGSGSTGGVVKRQMIALLSGKLSEIEFDYLDELAASRLEAAREYAKSHQLNGLGISIYDGGEKGHETDSEAMERISQGYNEFTLIHINPPVDAAALDAIVKVLEAAGMEPGGMNNIPVWRMNELVDTVLDNWDTIVQQKEELFDVSMLEDIKNNEKYNYIFHNETLKYAYVNEKLDLDGAKKWLEAYKRFAATLE